MSEDSLPSAQTAFVTLSRFDRILADRKREDLRAALWNDPFDSGAASAALDAAGDQLDRRAILQSLETCKSVKRAQLPPPLPAAGIYELMLALSERWVSSPRYVHRGHADADWLLIPSWFRGPIRRSIHLLHRGMDARFTQAQKRVGSDAPLAPFEREAVVQHYGSGTMLLDCTESMRVAAFFATFELRSARGELGALYVFDTQALADQHVMVLRPNRFPGEYVRIHTTRSCFLQGWARGEEFESSAYLQRESAAPGYAGSVRLKDENPYVLEAALASGAGNAVREHLFVQTGVTFADPAWRISAEELDYEPSGSVVS